MQKLESDKQFPVTRENIARILSAYAIVDFDYTSINEGIANTALYIRTKEKSYVLRLYVQGKNLEPIQGELRFQELLRSNDIPVPIVYPNKDGEPITSIEKNDQTWHAILMEKLEGQSVTEHPSPALAAELANIQGRMHLLGVAFADQIGKPEREWEVLHDSLAEKITDVPIEAHGVLTFIERAKSYRYPLPPGLPHGYNHLDIDFDGNVLTKNDRVVGIIDFDDLQYSPIVVCLGYTLWNILDDNGEESMRQYLAEYEKARPLTRLERETLPQVIVFRNYIIGIIRLLLWEKDTPIGDITDLLKLEKEIPNLKF